jgi:glycosyltransferase involved in cell wall biosynthesis
MRVLLVHNSYKIHGGEDTLVSQERKSLSDNGFIVDLHKTSNDEISGVFNTGLVAIQTAYSFPSREQLRKKVQQFRPDVIHIHNFFPKLSPSIYDATENCAVVQTLHNYRLMCVSANLYRDGHICHDCVGKMIPWPGIWHACYRGSSLGSAAVAGMLARANLVRTWSTKVDRYITLTPFSRDRFIEHGLIPTYKLAVKVNAVEDPGEGDGSGGYLLYVGRLSEEKGINTLLTAAEQGLPLPLRIAGSGPLEKRVRHAADTGILKYLGALDANGVRLEMKKAAALICPSVWYEGLPMVIPEAFGNGLPVLASRIGSLASLITDDLNGILFEPSDPQDLRAKVTKFTASSSLHCDLRRGARKTYEATYHPSANTEVLRKIYHDAMKERDRRLSKE